MILCLEYYNRSYKFDHLRHNNNQNVKIRWNLR